LHASDFHFCTEANRKNRFIHWSNPKNETLKNFEKTTIRYLSMSSWKNWFGGIADGRHRAQHLAQDFYFSSFRPQATERFARFIEANESSIDLLVLTGDLATTGQSTDLEEAKRWLTVDSTWLSRLRMDKQMPPVRKGVNTLLMPGNHDRYKDGVGSAGGLLFDQLFRDYWPKLPSMTNRVSWEAIGSGESLIVVAADFSLRSNHDIGVKEYKRFSRLLGRGYCHQDVLLELVNTTEQLKKKYQSAAIVWALHFPIGNVDDDALALVDWVAARDAALKLGIRVVLAGHLHQHKNLEHGDVKVLVSGSCCAVDFEDQLSFAFIEINTNGSEISNLKRTKIEFVGNTFRYADDRFTERFSWK
jgi:predicted phosphodiesterase